MPPAPGDSFAIECDGAPSPGAPTITGWNETVLPGEPFTLSGDAFSVLPGSTILSDTHLWLWADGFAAPQQLSVEQSQEFASDSKHIMIPVKNNDPFTSGRIAPSSNRVLHSRLPRELAMGVYFLSVENAAGFSDPIVMNRPRALWIGPLGLVAEPGQRKRLFGMNLSHEHGSTSSHLYVVPEGGSSFVEARVTHVEPYSVEFECPKTLGSYKIYVHSGHGGRFGWGNPLQLIVGEPWKRSNRSIILNPSGGDDTRTIQPAIDLLAGSGGGTIRLGPGTYLLMRELALREGICLKGAGMDLCSLRFNLSSSASECVRIQGSHASLEDLELFLPSGVRQPVYGMLKTAFPSRFDDLALSGVRFRREDHPSDTATNFGPRCSLDFVKRAEVVHCEFDESLSFGGGEDCWVHNCVFHGGPFGQPGAGGGTESAVYGDGDSFVLERNIAYTPRWPRSITGSRNYLKLLPSSVLRHMIWARRFFLQGVNRRSPRNGYYAWNEVHDVAVEENKGEIFLFHDSPSGWFAQVESAQERIVNIRTDGLLFGQRRSKGLEAAALVPETIGGGASVDESTYLVVIAGPGVGQANRVAFHTANSITLKDNWRVPPTKESVVTLTCLRTGQIVYHNLLGAFPAGYEWKDGAQSASMGIQFHGNTWNCVAESNTSLRTFMARGMGGEDTAPTYWTAMRGEIAVAPHCSAGFALWSWSEGNARIGYDLLGSRYLNESIR